ncbi:hypothetical protein ARMGADRAFT_1026058 [Armillaria gallica]|uniref:Uncharacterized protein n=1 Tax=Armillaria gallica TaxID=47427 RepID=A0A2H3E8B9_ARMGA|nr:hypothetical protein ARMGADRAFT_1026058 [Armillaria gallica]
MNYSNVPHTTNLSCGLLEGNASYLNQTTGLNAPALHHSTCTEPIEQLSMEKAVKSDDKLQGLFMQCTFLTEHLKTGCSQVTKDSVEQEAVEEEADQGMEDAPVNSHGETQENNDRQNLSKCTQLYKTLLQKESKQKAELEKWRNLSERDTSQGNFDKELGMECLKLSGEETGQLEFKHLALLGIWTGYKGTEMERQQCLLCLCKDRLPEAIHY